jgi:biotin carboxyl carrier protein
MPEYNVAIENRTYKVELAKKEGKGAFEAKINDKQVELKLEENETGAISPLTLKIGGKEYRIEFEKIDRHAPFTLKVNNAPFKAQLKETPKKMVTPTPTVQLVAKAERRRETATAQEGVVLAPMAGKVVSVKAKKGDDVKAGDVVCILEAMKMENEITATKTGKVQEVNVAEGTPVNEGDILIVIT